MWPKLTQLRDWPAWLSTMGWSHQDEMPTSGSPVNAHNRLFTLSIGALGVVYGDIGTSPLYALRECFSERAGIPVNEANVLGVLSLILWSLIIIVSIKYQMFVLRADNRGEGGILALLALLNPWRTLRQSRWAQWLITLGVFGAALLYCDGVITPAISVLSAVEGIEIATPAFEPYVVPITILILIGLFRVQRFGTSGVGSIFGPVMVVWFALLALLGLQEIIENLHILRAANPIHALSFMGREGKIGFLVLGGVFLTVTGGEALYADIGHFGRRPIRLVWFSLVLPALLLNYFGQGALLLNHPEAIAHPFYSLAPHWALYPFVTLATLATVIASQAVISGAFSLMRQAVQLGLTPRVRIVQTSSMEIGQIYVPILNTLLMIACVLLVLIFRSSSALASAYGVAISTTMLITTLLMFFAMRRKWRWPLWVSLLIMLVFLSVDIPFFLANLYKIREGGWLPLLASGLVFIIMSTWSNGRRNLIDRLREDTESLDAFFDHLDLHPPVRVPGTGIFMTAPKLGAPPALKHHLRHSEALHDRVILLTVLIVDEPRVPIEQRLEYKKLRHGFYRLFVRYGFMQSPDLPSAIDWGNQIGIDIDINNTTFFIGRETLIITDDMPWSRRWREKLYAFMFRNAVRATDFYKIPPQRAVEIGIWVEAVPWTHRQGRTPSKPPAASSSNPSADVKRQA